MEFTLYTKNNCQFCQMAKEILDENGYGYDVLLIPADATVKMLQEKVADTGSKVEVRSVPQIFHGPEYIGGVKELVKYVESL